MKKHLLTMVGCASLALGSMSANAQVADGSYAADFTFNDLNGNSINLYSLLDSGYTVYIDVSAAWCGPCWSYHTGVTNGSGGVGALHKLWEDHGPSWGAGVSPSTTNDVYVIYVEGETTNTLAQLQGVNAGSTYATASQGDWITGTNYPIIDLPSNSAGTAFLNDYNIGYFPTVYAICPDRTITETGQATVTTQYAARNNCSFSIATNDGGTHVEPTMNNNLMSCDSVAVSVAIINYGTAALTSADIEVRVDGILQKTVPWTGNLATFDHAAVNCGNVGATGVGSHTVTFTLVNPNGGADGQASNDSNNSTFSILSPVGGPVIAEAFTTGSFPPTGWTILQGSDVAHNWARVSDQQIDGTTGNVTRIEFFDISSGDVDDMILKGVDLSSGTFASLAFDISHKRYSASYSDALKVYVSTNCGNTWTQVYSKSGAALATVTGYTTTEWSPAGASDWRHESVNLNAYAGNSNLMVKFEATSGYGNDLFVDNININNNSVTSIEEQVASFTVNVYPNPVNDQMNIALNMLNNADVKIEIRNSVGQVVDVITKQGVAAGSQVVNASTANLQSGMYFVHVTIGNTTAIEKITVLK